MAISEGLVIGLVLISVRNIWGHAYSNEEEVVKYVGKVLLVISVSNFFDGIQCVLSGTVFTTTLHNFCCCNSYICSFIFDRNYNSVSENVITVHYYR